MAGPYDIQQFSAAQALGMYDAAKQRRLQEMLTQRQLDEQDRQIKQKNDTAAAWAKIFTPKDQSMSGVAGNYGTATGTPTPLLPPAMGGPATPAAVAPAMADNSSLSPRMQGVASAVDAMAPESSPVAPQSAPVGANGPGAAVVVPAPSTAPVETPVASKDNIAGLPINRDAIPQLIALNPEQGFALLQHLSTLDAAQRQQVAVRNEQLGKAAFDVLYNEKGQPRSDADMQAAYQHIVPGLIQAGLITPDHIAEFQPTRDNLVHLLHQAQDLDTLVKSTEPDLMTVGNSVIDKNNPEKGAVFTAPANYSVTMVKNADGSEVPYAFDPRTGHAFQLSDTGQPGGGGNTAGAAAGSALAGNNPGGIVDSAFAKSQPGYKGANGRFAEFDTLDHGIAAQVNLLHSYISRGIDTPAKIATRWAPKGDGSNDPTAYAANIAKQMGIGVNDKIGPDQLAAFQHAQAIQENAMYGHTAQGSAGLGKPIAGAPATISPVDAETMKFIGGQVALGQPMPPLGMGKDAATMRKAILAEATKQWREMGISPGEANVIAAQNKSGLAELAKIAQIKANVQTAENTANSNADQVISLLGSTGTTGVPIFNAWQQAGRRSVAGDPKIAQFDVAVKTLATEYARVMSGGNSQQLSDSARHEADALLHTDMTADQFRSAIAQMKIDMANRTAGIEKERQATLSQIRTGGQGAPASAPSTGVWGKAQVVHH